MSAPLNSIVILGLIAMGAYHGWKVGAVAKLTTFIALIGSLLFVKANGDDVLVSIFHSIIGFIKRTAGKMTDSNVESQTEIEGMIAKSGLNDILAFAVSFGVIYLIISVLIRFFNTRRMPVVGIADGVAGVIVGAISQMVLIWAAMTVLYHITKGSQNIFSQFPVLDGGLFRLMYTNNPILRFILGHGFTFTEDVINLIANGGMLWMA